MGQRGALLLQSHSASESLVSFYLSLVFLVSTCAVAGGNDAHGQAVPRRLLTDQVPWNGPDCFAARPEPLIQFPEFVRRADETWNPGNARIPHVFHRIYTNRGVTARFCYSFQETATADPSLDFTLVDFPTAEEFIRTRCGEDVAWAFRMLLPGAYRADLYRYCVLFAEGGYAVDLGFHLKAPLSSFVPPNTTFVVAEDPGLTNVGAWVGFTGAVAGHPLLRACMDLVVENVRACWYETRGETVLGPLAITGPELLGNAIRRHWHLAPSDTWAVGNVSDPLLLLPAARNNEGFIQIFSPDSRRTLVGQNKFAGQEMEFLAMGYMSPQAPHYSVLWWQRAVYNKSACEKRVVDAGASEQSARLTPSKQSATSTPSKQSATLTPSKQSTTLTPKEPRAGNAALTDDAKRAQREAEQAEIARKERLRVLGVPDGVKLPVLGGKVSRPWPEPPGRLTGTSTHTATPDQHVPPRGTAQGLRG